MRLKIVVALFLLMTSFIANAQLPDKDLVELAKSVQERYNLFGSESSNLYKTSSGYVVLVSVVRGESVDEAKMKASREATEFVVGALTNSTSVYSSEGGLTVSKETFSDKIVQTSLGQVNSMQMLCRFNGIDGSPLFAFFLVMSSTNAHRGLAGMMSMVIPGSGQFYKGNKGKGSMFLGLTIAAGAGFVVCESTRSSYVNKIDNLTSNIHLYGTDQANAALKEYRENVNVWETRRNLCIGAIGAIYIWNVIDAFFTEGKQRPVVTTKTSRNLTISPQLSDDNLGFGLTYTF